MKYTYYIADVFTQQLFNGAQIAVFPNADGLNAENMTLIARELNLSETVFIFHHLDDSNRRRMRIFSPLAEIDFAGHPLIAAGYVLGHCGDVALTAPITPIVFEQNSGAIEANISSENGKPSFVQFSRSVKPLVDRFAPTDQELAQFLGIAQSELDHNPAVFRIWWCRYGIMNQSAKPVSITLHGASPSPRKPPRRKFCCSHPNHRSRMPISTSDY